MSKKQHEAHTTTSSEVARVCFTPRMPLFILGFWMTVCAGTLYAFPAFEVELKSQCTLSAKGLNMVYAAGQLGLGMGIIPGVIYDRLGPGAVCCWAFVLLLTGNFGLSIAIHAHGCGGETSLVMLYFLLQHGSQGFLQAGLFSNIRMTPASSRGAVTGAITAGFGLSAVVWVTAYKQFFGHSLVHLFRGAGVVCAVTSLIAVFAIPRLIRSIESMCEYHLVDVEDAEVRAEGSVTQAMGKSSVKDQKFLRDVICQPEFWLLLGIFSLLQGVGSGIFIANISIMAQSFGIPEDRRVTYVQAVSYCNCGGRLLAGYIMDRFEAHGIPRGMHLVWTGSIMACVTAFMWLLPEHFIPGIMFPALIAVGFVYGANYAIMPSFIASRFGMANMGVCFSMNTALMSCMVLATSITAGSLYDAESKVINQAISQDDTTGTLCAGARCWRGAYLLGLCLSSAGLICAGLLAWRLNQGAASNCESLNQRGET